MDRILENMNYLDIIILVFFVIEFIWMVYFLVWQFKGTDMSEEDMQRIIRALNAVEWIIFILTRFLQYGKWGKIGLAAFYICITVLLVLQYIFTDWGAWAKFKNILWIGYYVILFLIDIMAVDVVGELATKIGPKLVEVDLYLKNSWLGGVLASIISGIVKGVFFSFTRSKRKSEKREL